MSLFIPLHAHEFIASSADLPGQPFMKVSSLGLSVKFFREGYINTVVWVYDEKTKLEQWFIHKDNHSWVEIAPEQLWFWSKEWQTGEREVDSEREQGLVKHFNTVDDLTDFLNE